MPASALARSKTRIARRDEEAPLSAHDSIHEMLACSITWANWASDVLSRTITAPDTDSASLDRMQVVRAGSRDTSQTGRPEIH